MSSRVPPVMIALLLITVCAFALALAEGGAGIGVSIYAVVAVVTITFSHARPDGWPGRLFEVSRASRTLLAHRLLTQMAALVCLVSAHFVGEKASYLGAGAFPPAVPITRDALNDDGADLVTGRRR